MKFIQKISVIGLSVCMLSIVFSSTSMATKIVTEEHLNSVNEKNKKEVNYYKNDSAKILAQETKTVVIETEKKDKSLLEQKTKEFEEKMKMEQLTFIEEGLKKATTLQDVEKVKSEAANLLTKEKELFKAASEKYVKTKIDTEKVNLAMISSSYETVKDDFFTFNKHKFYYYDVNKNEFVPNNKVNKIEEVKEFEKNHIEDSKVKDNPINTLILFILLALLCIIPLLISNSQKNRA
ncbi:hypothetical protein C7Y47_21015 [Lysinibacillus sphaericus]|uniref:Uncharacterized protein n=1 Tax=Lysinibacillus sphaericus TaxID=1421 RepID=A0A544U8V8_LYSSH|nr:hypothetical protein [Lysinibacillus sp. SDF0037]TQR28536.1 hypothetical protein C7Y47_21015 [Lysinibacillus sp. SDF0037]